MGDAQMYTAKARKATAETERLGGGKAVSQRVKKQSAGKTAAQMVLFGSYGALKYNQARAKHASRGEAAAKATLYSIGNNMTGGLLEFHEDIQSRKRKYEALEGPEVRPACKPQHCRSQRQDAYVGRRNLC